MKKALLYRFHEGVELHVARLQIMRHFNPDVPIHIVAGGRQPAETRASLAPLVDSFWEHPSEDGDWRWRSGDLIIRDWYAAAGYRYAFDHVYDCEWDVLLTAGIEDIFPAVPRGTLALTALDSLETYETRWIWTSAEPYKTKSLLFFRYMATRHGMGFPKFFCFWPGAVLPRSYLEALHSLEIPDSIPLICELTTPAVAEMLGFPMLDTKLMPNISRSFGSALISPYFHTQGSMPVSRQEAVAAHLGETPVRRPKAFHPVKECVRLQDLQRSFSSLPRHDIGPQRSAFQSIQ